ncbi:MAG: metalloregulator ArsR/SmtB family transcription factor [Pseudomonadota bacterium]
MFCASPLPQLSRLTRESEQDLELLGSDSEFANPFDGNSELLKGDDDINRASRSLKAMSHPLRLKILCTLGEQEMSVQNIVDSVGTSQSNISQHLAILRDKGILAARKDSNRVFYRVSDSRTLELIGMIRAVFCSRGL